jgi:hypothetical protein
MQAGTSIRMVDGARRSRTEAPALGCVPTGVQDGHSDQPVEPPEQAPQDGSMGEGAGIRDVEVVAPPAQCPSGDRCAERIRVRRRSLPGDQAGARRLPRQTPSTMSSSPHPVTPLGVDEPGTSEDRCELRVRRKAIAAPGRSSATARRTLGTPAEGARQGARPDPKPSRKPKSRDGRRRRQSSGTRPEHRVDDAEALAREVGALRPPPPGARTWLGSCRA